MTRTRKSVGRIAFVGAGPGDPCLLTRRAHDALVTADHIVYDRSVPAALLDSVRAFPTTIFLRSDGSVRAVHQGYCGPATGPEHQKLREDFERLISELLADRKPASR